MIKSNPALPLRTLVLASNTIGEDGAAALIAAVRHNAHLTTLDGRGHNVPAMKTMNKVLQPDLSCNLVRLLACCVLLRLRLLGSGSSPASAPVLLLLRSRLSASLRPG